jgi:hypothetical protein
METFHDVSKSQMLTCEGGGVVDEGQKVLELSPVSLKLQKIVFVIAKKTKNCMLDITKH